MANRINRVFLLTILLVSFTFIAFAQPLPPINVRIYTYQTYNRLIWDHHPLEAAGYVANYQICRGNSSGSTSPVAIVGGGGGGTAYNDSSAGYNFNQEFYYTIQAIGTDALVSQHSQEVKRFLPRAGLTKIPMQTNTITGQHYINFDAYPGECTDVYFRIRTTPLGGSNWNLADYANRPVLYHQGNLELPPGGPYWAEVRIYRPDWWSNPANRYEYSICYSEPFYVNAEVPYEDNASSTYFNSSQNRVMSAPLAAGGVESIGFSNSGGDFWRMRTPIRVLPYTELLRDPTSYLSKFQAPCRVTVTLGPGQLNTGRAASEVRVADEFGNEIPSLVVSENTSGPWVTSFDLHFITNQDWDDNMVYWVYWGNPAATPNPYDFKTGVKKPAPFEYSA